MMIFLLTGTLANYYEYTHVGWPIFLESKVTKIEILHYTHYITNFLTYSMIMSYIGYRETYKYMKLLSFIVFAISLVGQLVWLNRGPFLLLFFVVGLYEFLRSIKYNRTVKYFWTIFMMSIIFIVAFGYIGDIRVSYVMENIYGYTVNEHYEIPEWVPTPLTWIYIYCTSPLENFRDIFYNQNVTNYRYGMLLFYPFLAPVFKLIFDTRFSTYPYLDDIVGLNVSSFLNDAYNDFYIFGPYIYILYYALMFFIAIKLFSRGVYGFLAYASVVNMGAFMFFVNGFAIGPFMIGFLVFATLSLIYESKKKKKTLLTQQNQDGVANHENFN